MKPALGWSLALAASGLLLSGCTSFKDRVTALDEEIETWGPPGSGITLTKLPAVINILASYEATPHQMREAQRRAEAYYAEVLEKERPAEQPVPAEPVEVAATPAAPAPAAPDIAIPPEEPVVPEEPEVAAAEPVEGVPPEPEMLPEDVPVPTLEEIADNPQSDIIAVEVPQDERSTGKKSVMLWHTHSRTLVGNKVYDIEQEPEEGDIVELREASEGSKFRTYTARYIGARAPAARLESYVSWV